MHPNYETNFIILNNRISQESFYVLPFFLKVVNMKLVKRQNKVNKQKFYLSE